MSKYFLGILFISILLLVVEPSLSQNSLIGKWTFSEINSKDSSLIISVSEKAKLREFVLTQKKINWNSISKNLIDTINKMIDKEVILIISSSLKFNTDSTFDISKNELLIPKAIPGIVVEGIFKGKWQFDEKLQVVNFETDDKFIFHYKIIDITPEKLSVGIIYSLNQFPHFIITFKRS